MKNRLTQPKVLSEAEGTSHKTMSVAEQCNNRKIQQ